MGLSFYVVEKFSIKGFRIEDWLFLIQRQRSKSLKIKPRFLVALSDKHFLRQKFPQLLFHTSSQDSQLRINSIGNLKNKTRLKWWPLRGLSLTLGEKTLQQRRETKAVKNKAKFAVIVSCKLKIAVIQVSCFAGQVPMFLCGKHDWYQMLQRRRELYRNYFYFTFYRR